MKNDYPAFTPTQFDTVKDKEKFALHFQRFVTNGFSRGLFPKWFYTRLSMTFGHIAHYNKLHFYDNFFLSESGKAEFLHLCLTWPCYGDPEFTYSDVERYLQDWLQEYVREYPL